MSNRKLIITRHKQQIITSLFDDFDLIQVNIEEEDTQSILGNIYIGKVKNIVQNINAAFIEIEDKQMCYLSLEKKTKIFFKDGSIRETVKQGDEIFVQISKEDIKTKAPVANTELNLTGKYLVLVHGKSMVGVSSKLSISDKKRLRRLVFPFIDEHFGFIVRTNAADAEDEMVIAEASMLIKKYEVLKSTGVYRTCFSMIHQALPAYLAEIRDGFSEELEEIITDDIILYEQSHSYLAEYQEEDIKKLRFYEDDYSLSRLYGINNKIAEACREKVWLKSGASLIIQPTEALTVIDVNTGKAIHGKKDIHKTFFNVNKEAAKEIAKQIRLRNISGIIIIDFINMDSQEDKEQLLEILKNHVKSDPVKTTVIDMTALNLVEMTRKKVRKSLLEQYCQLN